jgi:hypothetical protein
MIEKQAGGIKALTSALDRRFSSASNCHDMTHLTTNRSKKKPLTSSHLRFEVLAPRGSRSLARYAL